MMKEPKVLKATCLCGQVRIEIRDEFLLAGYCHCSECQKFSGSASSAWARIERSKVRFVEGEDLIRLYHKNATGRVGFCGNCGSSLFNGQQNGPFINIRLGVLDDEPSVRPSIHVFCESSAPWADIEGPLPRFDTIP